MTALLWVATVIGVICAVEWAFLLWLFWVTRHRPDPAPRPLPPAAPVIPAEPRPFQIKKQGDTP